MRKIALALLGLSLLVLGPAGAGQQAPLPEDFREALAFLGSRTSDYSGGVLKVSVPRGDLKVTVKGEALPTAFGFGGWVALTHGDGGARCLGLLKKGQIDRARSQG